ncbi:Insulinase (Peptidase M16) [Ceratobasidium sp. 394]|nr:Insulinase (Peptidase M16) [Ceratobasidium sp. 394]
MKLVVLGKESLDELSEMVVREFSAVKNRNIGRTPPMLEDPRGGEHNGIIVYAKTVMDFRAIEISWSCEWQPPNYLSKPATILGHLLGHEGPGSIHAYLKNKGWISYLSAGIHGGGRGFSFFKVITVLTKDGMDHYTEVLSTVYKYLAFLRNSELPTYIYEESKSIAESRFRFAEKRSADKYVSSLAERLSGPYPRDLVLCAESLMWEWDEPAVRKLLDTFTVEASRVMLMAKDGLPEGNWLKEKWYKAEYWIEKLPASLVEQAKDLGDLQDLYIPKPNEFIPKNFDVVKTEGKEPAKSPTKLITTPLSTLWHKKDDQFWVPKARVILRLLNPICNATPRHSLLSRLFADLVKDALAEFTYDAELAGMKYSIVNDGGSLVVVSEGYNDKLPVLLQHVLEKAILNARPISAAEQTLPRSLLLPPGKYFHLWEGICLILVEACNYVWEDPVPNKDDLNSSITYYVEVGDSCDPRLRAVLSLFGQMVSEPAFNQLRTKEQLGYVVSSGVWLSTGSAGWRIVVQSERRPRYLESRVDNFLDLFRETLATMPDAEFERQRDSYALKRLEKLKNLGEEASRFWTHIESGYEDFLRRETDAANIKQLRREDVISFFNEHIHYGSPTRRKLSVHLFSQKKPPTKFSVEASEALLKVLKEEGVPVQEDQYRQLSAAQPPLESVLEFWTKQLEGHKSAISILARIPHISTQHPVAGVEVEPGFPIGATPIHDIASFKAGLTASKAPTPINT